MPCTTTGLNHIREQMMEGNGLADPLAETGLFPAAARQMFRVGEETGTLDKQLDTAAAFYHRELEIKVKHFTSLFEPAIIIFMGVDRRLRRDRPGLGHVRHLPPSQRRLRHHFRLLSEHAGLQRLSVHRGSRHR